MKLNLPSSISSQQDLGGLVLELREYSRWINHQNILKKVSSKSSEEPPVMSPALKDLLSDNKKESENIEELINTLDKFKDDASTITVTLAAPATKDIKRTLNDWLRKNIASNILVNYQFNATLLGGMVIRVGSHIFDWSFRRQILANRDKFPEVLRNV
jgi:F0F1-type ATP synthase delta subunit